MNGCECEIEGVTHFLIRCCAQKDTRRKNHVQEGMEVKFKTQFIRNMHPRIRSIICVRQREKRTTEFRYQKTSDYMQSLDFAVVTSGC